MRNENIKEHWQWVCLWCAVIFSALYSRPLIPIDETRYFSVAWEMWQSHNFLVPHINGEPYSHKPPLLFWLIHLFWSVFGVKEWAGRLVGPLFGLSSVALTIRLATILWPEQRNIKRALPFILLGSSIWTIFGSLTMFDTLLTFFSLLSLISILKAAKSPSIWPWIWLGISIGLGILAKGPVIFLFVLPPILLAPLWLSQKSLPWKWWYISALLSCIGGIGIAACWAIPAAFAGGKEYEQAILFSQTAGRMVKSFAHARPFYWYLLLTPLLGLPWFFFIPSWRGWKNTSADRSIRFCLCALIPSLIILSFVSGKQIHYVMPILPVGALLLARIITASSHRTKHDNMTIVLILFVLSIVLIIVPQLPLHGGDMELIGRIPKQIALVPFLCGVLLFFVRTRSTLTSAKAVSLTMVALMVGLHLTVAAPLHNMYDQSVISDAIHRVQSKGGKIAVYPAKLSDQFQFAGRLTAPLIPERSIHEIEVWAKEHRNAFCLIFTRDPQVEQMLGTWIVQPYKNGWLLLRSTSDFYPDYVKLGQAS